MYRNHIPPWGHHLHDTFARELSDSPTAKSDPQNQVPEGYSSEYHYSQTSGGSRLPE